MSSNEHDMEVALDPKNESINSIETPGDEDNQSGEFEALLSDNREILTTEFFQLKREIKDLQAKLSAQDIEMNEKVTKADFNNIEALVKTLVENRGTVNFDSQEISNGDDNHNNNKRTGLFFYDSYGLMVVSDIGTLPWNVGVCVWVFQSGMYTLLMNDQILRRFIYNVSDDPTENLLRIPPVVSPYVSVAQVFALLVTNWMHDDLFASSHLVSLSLNKAVWLRLSQQIGSEYQSSLNRLWWERIGLSSFLKASQGLAGMVVTVVVVLQNQKIIELFKDFTALMFISELDEIVFTLSRINHFGRNVQIAANRVDSIELVDSDDAGESSEKKHRFKLYRVAQFASFLLMIIVWAVVLNMQLRGTLIRKKYPNCQFVPDTFNEWRKLGNADCEIKYNNPSCGFDGGDCESFNRKYPLCMDAKEPFKVGDGVCHAEYNTTACRYDGYDCFDEWFDETCLVQDVELLGDGICHSGEYNSEACLWDAGDCKDFNEKYPNCKVENPYLIGNSVCNHDQLLNLAQRKNFNFVKEVMADASLYMSRQCGFDGGDCLDYLFPDCNVDQLDYLSNDICDNYGDYNTVECGFDGGDCLMFNFIYPDCDAKYDYWLLDTYSCNLDPSHYVDGSPTCNFNAGNCIDMVKFPDCKATFPPLMSRGYCRPECGITKENSDCIFFEEKYPNCQVADFDEIGNGVCDNSVYNIADCGYEDYDCVDVTLECHVDKPEWIGDGVCHAGALSPYNTTECGYDGGDCVEANTIGQFYNCSVDIPSYLGDGVCNGFSYNSEDCAFDGGDCVELNKAFPLLYPFFQMQYPKCSVVDPVMLFDNVCQLEDIKRLNISESDPLYDALIAYNTSECGYDRGSCLSSNPELEAFTLQYPDCNVGMYQFLFDGLCTSDFLDLNNDEWYRDMMKSYNTSECGYDNGACVYPHAEYEAFQEQYPNCNVRYPHYLFDGICIFDLFPKGMNWIWLNYMIQPFNTSECGYDNGDCV